jgi:hypothetical protein
MELWKSKYDKFEVHDLVSNFGIEKSSLMTEECLSLLAERTLINKIKQYVV